jgi:hypothetical protein
LSVFNTFLVGIFHSPFTMSLDNATRCCRSILPNERVPLISVDDLLAGELKRYNMSSWYHYQMPMLMGGTAPLVLSLGTLRVLYCTTRCEPGLNSKENKTTSLLAVLEGDMISERLQMLGSLEAHMQTQLGNGVTDFLIKHQINDSRMASVHKKLCLLDRSRIEKGILNRQPTIALEIKETGANLKPTFAHMNRDTRVFRRLEGSLTDHLKSMEYIHNGPSGDEILYHPFLLQGACVQIKNCTVTSQYNASVGLFLREATVNLDTLDACANINANPAPLLSPCDTAVSLLEADVVLGRPIEMSEETMAMGWKDGIWMQPAAPASLVHFAEHGNEYQRLFNPTDYTNALFNLTATHGASRKTPAFAVYGHDVSLGESQFTTEFPDDRKKPRTVTTTKDLSVKTAFKVHVNDNGRMKRIVLRTFDSTIGFVSEVKRYGKDNVAVQVCVSVESDLPILTALNANIKALILRVLEEKKMGAFKGPKGAVYHKKMVEAAERFSMFSVKYNSIRVELVQRPGTRAFATTRTRVDDRLIPVIEFTEGLIRPIRFRGTASEFEGVIYSSVSDSWTCVITCKEVIAPSEVHSSGQASMLTPTWFDEDDVLTDQTVQAAVVEEVYTAAAGVEDVLLTQKRLRDAGDEEGVGSPSKNPKR